jgi:hypothetical protein
LYACVKTTMLLRTFGDIPRITEQPLRRFRLLAVLAGALFVLLTALAGGSGAGISNYQGTLYLSGGSSAIGGSFQLLTTPGPGGAAMAPAAAAGVAGSGGITGTYSYIYVRTGGSGARSASASSPPLAVNNAPMTVNNVPVGSVLYRQKSSSGTYVLIDPSTAVTPYVDTNPDPPAGTPVLGNAENRLAALAGNTYVDFSPGVAPASTAGNVPPASSATPSIPGTCKGWTVDAPAGFSFPAGPWAYTVAVKSNGSGSGSAYLVAGMWKVDAAGAPVAGGTILNPATAADGSQNLITAGATTQAVTYPAPASTVALPTFTLAANERLCIQFWRHQTTAYAGGGFSQRTLALLPYDNSTPGQVTHPAPNAFAAATLSSPADNLHTTSIPTLAATYSDPEGDPGNLTIRLCADAGCSSPVSSGPLVATAGATLTWTPAGPLADGQYWWEAQAQDTLGLPSGWTTSQTFYIDNSAPTTSITSSPAALSNAASGSFSFSANESVTGYQCRIGGAAFAPCTSPYSYGPLADGAQSFDVKAAADLAGNAGTTTNYSWTIDTVPSDTSITSKPAALSNTASPSFGFSATEAGSTFECSLDGGAFAACPTPQSYSGVADGAHTFQVRAVDPAGNLDPSPASYAWTIDATPPDTTIGPSFPAALTIATGATFDFSSTESPSTFQCALDGGAYASCSTPKSYSGLADGAHTFYVRATDVAANTDPSPAFYTWTVDTTPPATAIGPTVPAANTQSPSATFDLASNEPGSTFECRLDGALFGSCTTPVSYAALADGTHTFDVRATDPAGNLDSSPASYTWKIDNVAPSTPTLTAPADAVTTNSLPQLQAIFADGTAGGDSGTVQFQLCSSAAPAGVACAPVVQSVTSGLVSNGATANATPSAVADGTYYWQARAQDVAGNQSGWSATRSFLLDTSVPVVTVGAPADGAWLRGLQLSATFNKPAFAGTGSVDFRICSDPLCLGIVVSGSSGTVANGALATWSPSALPVDGLYYWQARSRDSLGNVSAWTTARTLHLDRVAPGKPPTFTGTIADDGLTLRWSAPNDNVANYVVFVNGAPWKNFGSTEFEVKMGAFDPGDTRSFSVVAVDLAGNVGVMSPVLVGVPNLVGLTWTQALGVTSARGLGLRRNAVFFASIPMVVSAQQPPAPALTERGTAVLVTMSPAAGAPLAVKASPGSFACAAGSVLRLRIDLSAAAQVRSRLLNSHGRVLKRAQLGLLGSGTNNVRVKLSRALRRGAYRLMLDATGKAGTAHALVRIKVGTSACRAR